MVGPGASDSTYYLYLEPALPSILYSTLRGLLLVLSL